MKNNHNANQHLKVPMIEVILLVFFISAMICTIYYFAAEYPCLRLSGGGYFAAILSGLLGSFLSAIIVWISLENENKVSKTDAHLRLREMFATESRMRIHELLLLYQSVCDANHKDESFLKEKFFTEKTVEINTKKQTDKSIIEKELKKDIANLYDYLGIFEIAEKMLDDGILDEELFWGSYGYRIKAIDFAFKEFDLLKKQKEDKNEIYWFYIDRLIEKSKEIESKIKPEILMKKQSKKKIER